MGIDISVDVYAGDMVLGALVGVADFSLSGRIPLGSVASLELRAGP